MDRNYESANEDLAGREPTYADSVPCLRHIAGCSTGAHPP